MSTNFSSISPVDRSIVWQGKPSDHGEIDATMERAHHAADKWRRIPMEERIEIVSRYQSVLALNRETITDLIGHEVGKLDWEASGEVNAAIAKVNLSIDAIKQRRSTVVLDSSMAANSVRRRIDYQPLGVALVLGPFNFPLHLPGGQIIPALLAGNSVVFKPSEQATGVGTWMADAWVSAGLPQDVLQIIVGGPDVAVRAIDSSRTSIVFLTGSRNAGRAIHRQLAGRPDVLLALELGGNNPIVIADDATSESVASIVSASAFVTAGQRCTCARRAIFVSSDSTNDQIERLIDRTETLRLGMPGDDPTPEIGPLISTAAATELRKTYDQLLKLGCRPLIPPVIDERAMNLVRPMMVDATDLSPESQTELGEMEWFGPLLVIQRMPDFDSAIRAAANTPYGLAAALLGGTQSMFDQLVSEVGAGVINWNGTTTGAAGTLPFGGLGDSGNHRPAGFFAIDACGDPIAILERPSIPSDDPWEAAH